MTSVIPLSFENNFALIKNRVYERVVNWSGRAVVELERALKALQEDPRFASLSLFFGNFFIIEIANHIGHFVSQFFPKNSTLQSCVKHLTGVGIVVAANSALVKALGIKLHPVVVSAIVSVSFMAYLQMKNYLTAQ